MTFVKSCVLWCEENTEHASRLQCWMQDFRAFMRWIHTIAKRYKNCIALTCLDSSSLNKGTCLEGSINLSLVRWAKQHANDSRNEWKSKDCTNTRELFPAIRQMMSMLLCLRSEGKWIQRMQGYNTREEAKCRCYQEGEVYKKIKFYRAKAKWLRKILETYEQWLGRYSVNGSDKDLMAFVDVTIKEIRR